MFYTLSEKDHQFSKSSPSKLLSIVPLCAKTVVLFCNDRRFYHYSLYTKEILFEKELPGLPFKAVAVSSDRIALSIIDSRTVILIDAKTKDIK